MSCILFQVFISVKQPNRAASFMLGYRALNLEGADWYKLNFRLLGVVCGQSHSHSVVM